MKIGSIKIDTFCKFPVEYKGRDSYRNKKNYYLELNTRLPSIYMENYYIHHVPEEGSKVYKMKGWDRTDKNKSVFLQLILAEMLFLLEDHKYFNSDPSELDLKK